MSAEEELKKIVSTLNELADGKFKYSAKITTNAKGEGQIHCSIKSNESVDDAKRLLDDLITETVFVMHKYNIKLPGESK